MSEAARIIPVILCGGAGTRLWPLARSDRPKPLVSPAGGFSLLRQTLGRAAAYGPPLLVVASTQAAAVAAEASGGRMIVEPEPRGTAAAAARAALAMDPDDLLLVLPSDHMIADEAAFHAAVAVARPLAAQGWLVTFGIAPERPETGYGYIKRGAPLAAGSFRAAAFAEKPDRPAAEQWLAEGGWDWNAGIFLVRAGTLLRELKEFAPELLAGIRAGGSGFAAASLDKAVMERSERVAVVPVAMGWSDLGSWEAVHALGPLDEGGNLLAGDVVAPGSTGCLVRSDGPVVVALGVSDLVVVATERAVLVVPRGESQRVQEAIEALEARRGGRKGDE